MTARAYRPHCVHTPPSARNPLRHIAQRVCSRTRCVLVRTLRRLQVQCVRTPHPLGGVRAAYSRGGEP